MHITKWKNSMHTLTTCSHEILQSQVSNMTLPTWYLESNCIRVNVAILKAAITYKHFYNLINIYCLHNLQASKTSKDTSLHTYLTTVQFQTLHSFPKNNNCSFFHSKYFLSLFTTDSCLWVCILQSDSVARGPKLLSIKNDVIEIITWKFIYTYWERCKTGPVHNRSWNWSPFTSKHTWIRFSKFWNTFPKVSKLTAVISWRIASLSCSIVRGVFLYTLPFNRPQRKKSAGVRSASPCL